MVELLEESLHKILGHYKYINDVTSPTVGLFLFFFFLISTFICSWKLWTTPSSGCTAKHRRHKCSNDGISASVPTVFVKTSSFSRVKGAWMSLHARVLKAARVNARYHFLILVRYVSRQPEHATLERSLAWSTSYNKCHLFTRGILT